MIRHPPVARARPSSPSPKPRGQGFLVLLCLLAVLGIPAAAWSIPGGGPRTAILTLGFPCLILSGVWLHLLPDESSRRDLGQIVMLAIAVRLCVFAAVRHTVGPYVFAPDAWSYEIVGHEIVQSWGGLRDFPTKAAGSLQVGYYYLNAWIEWIFGPSPGGPALLNVFFGAWTTIPVYLLARDASGGNRGVARWAAYLVALFPSLVLWSVLNLREAPTILFLTGAVYAGGRIARGFSPSHLVLGCACLLAIALSRGYLTLLVGLALPLGWALSRGRNVVASTVAGLAFVGALVVVMGTNGVAADLALDPTLETLEAMRQGLGQGAQTAYGTAFNVSTPTGAARFLPIGLAHYLFAPFPWDLGSTLQSVTIPEMLLWYTLVPFTLRGLVLGLRHDPRAYAMLLVVLAAIIVPYSLVQGNVGTAFRHRAQILPLVFVFTSVGLRDWYGVMLARRFRNMAGRDRASRHLGDSSGGPSPVAPAVL